MHRCLELALLGKGKTKTNPLVGAVLVYNDEIIGEGYHQKYGEAHAEVNCINSVSDQNIQNIKDATIYINLEPCFHFGKTPPCVDLILKHEIKKVMIALQDPNPQVAGQSIEKLKSAGVEVLQDILKPEAIKLNKRFIVFQKYNRPYIILKYAISKNGYFSRKDKQQAWLSSAETSNVTHAWRAEEDAILVGKNTVIFDNPKLDVRSISGENPIRVILDSNLELDIHSNVFLDTAPVLLYNKLKNEIYNHIHFIKKETLKEIMHDMYTRNIQSIIIEGGLEVIQSFLKENLYDEIREIQTDTIIEDGEQAPIHTLKPINKIISNTDIIYFYQNLPTI
jgi:diaminohydroxyphosphoribosylaminopyrimidine deaminase/5-amino-6-(5-phosphoribosylamino)uracil reductase